MTSNTTGGGSDGEPDERGSGIEVGNVVNSDGSIAVGSNIIQNSRSYYIVDQAGDNATAQVIMAMTRLVLAAGYVVALITTLVTLFRMLAALVKIDN